MFGDNEEDDWNRIEWIEFNISDLCYYIREAIVLSFEIRIMLREERLARHYQSRMDFPG
jgi:hypothetical protein